MFRFLREVDDIWARLTLLSALLLLVGGLMIGSWFSPWGYKNCVHSSDCNDLNPCTEDRCTNHACVHTLIEAASCSNNGMCLSDEICSSGCQCVSNLTLSDFTSHSCNTSLCLLEELSCPQTTCTNLSSALNLTCSQVTCTSLSSALTLQGTILNILARGGISFNAPMNVTTDINLDSFLVAPDVKQSTQQFGTSVAACENRVFVGSPVRNTDDGSVYVYQTFIDSSMNIAQEVQILDGPTNSFFGTSVDVSSNCTYLVIGAIALDPSNRGGVFIYKQNETSSSPDYDLFQTILSPVPGTDFGQVVSITNNSVQTIFASDPPRNLVRVYEFNGTLWNLVASIAGNNTGGSDDFGISIDSYDDLVIIGASAKTSNQGSAYIFRRLNNIWVNTQILVSATPENNDKFGSCVALYQDIAIIGSSGATRNGVSSGGVYLFLSNGAFYIQETTLFPEELGTTANFGIACATNGDGLVLIGANNYDNPGTNVGLAILFSIIDHEFDQVYRLAATFPIKNSFFGSSVFISHNLTVVGIPFNIVAGVSSGSIQLQAINIPEAFMSEVTCFLYFPTLNSTQLHCRGELNESVQAGLYDVRIDASFLPVNASNVIDTWFVFSAYATNTRTTTALISVINSSLSLDLIFTAKILTLQTSRITIVASTFRLIKDLL